MGLFIALAAVLALGTAFLAVYPILFPRPEAESRDAQEARLFRDQLTEVDRDLERGVISGAEAEGARAEIARRLIAASKRAERVETLSTAPRSGPAGKVAGIAMVGLPAVAAILYLFLGAPGEEDQPLASRDFQQETAQQVLAQAEAEAAFGIEPPAAEGPEAEQFAALIVQLRDVLEERPNDAQGHRLLANSLMRMGRPKEAQDPFRRLIAILGEGVDAETLSGYAEALVQAAGGYVSTEARAVLRDALAVDPSDPIARYYAGVALAQGGRLPDALAIWERLRAESPGEAPWNAALDGLIADARAQMAGPPGPSAEDLAAAQAMSPEERMAMIEGMVAQLDDRLQAEGGTPEEWVRLIESLARLDRAAEARAAYDRSQSALSGSEAGFVREQALLIGVITE